MKITFKIVTVAMSHLGKKVLYVNEAKNDK